MCFLCEKGKQMSEKNNKVPEKKSENKKNVSIFEDTNGNNAKNRGMTISLKDKDEIIEADTDVGFFKQITTQS
jgi:hypothetical protein